MKEQEKALYDFQISEYKRKEEESKKAILRVDVITIANEWKVIITNEGESPAKNIRMESQEMNHDNGIIMYNEDVLPFPILNKGERIYIGLWLSLGYNTKPVIKLIWDDNFGIGRSVETALCLSGQEHQSNSV